MAAQLAVQLAVALKQPAFFKAASTSTKNWAMELDGHAGVLETLSPLLSGLPGVRMFESRHSWAVPAVRRINTLLRTRWLSELACCRGATRP